MDTFVTESWAEMFISSIVCGTTNRTATLAFSLVSQETSRILVRLPAWLPDLMNTAAGHDVNTIATSPQAPTVSGPGEMQSMVDPQCQPQCL